MDTNGLSAEEEWFAPFLNRIGDKNKGYHLEYLDMDEIRKELEKGECWFTEQKVYQLLLQTVPPYQTILCGRRGNIICGGYSRVTGGEGYRETENRLPSSHL